MIDVQRLRALRAVVSTGSMTAAAAVLGYTPSAVSQHLARLERETGLQLLERRGRGVQPTPSGRLLATEAARVLAGIQDVEALVDDLRTGRAGSLSIGYFASAGAGWVPGVIARLVREFPDIRIELRLGSATKATGADLELFVLSPRADATAFVGADYAVHRLFHDPFQVLVPSSHDLAGREAIDLSELSSEDWIDNDSADSPCRRIFLDACEREGFAPCFRIEAPDYRAAASFVAAGVGVTVVPALGVDDLPDGVVALQIVDPAPLRLVQVGLKAGLEQQVHARRALELLRISGRSLATRAASDVGKGHGGITLS